MNTQTQSAEAYTKDTRAYAAGSVIEKRLDTEKLMIELYKHLSGCIVDYEQQADGSIKKVMKQFGKPKANALGVQDIMAQFNAIVNPTGVQGNLKREQYDIYVKQIHRKMTKKLVANSNLYEIQTEEIRSIVSLYVNLVRTFLSRLIDNLERESYSDTIRATESNTLAQKGALDWLTGGNKV